MGGAGRFGAARVNRTLLLLEGQGGRGRVCMPELSMTQHNATSIPCIMSSHAFSHETAQPHHQSAAVLSNLRSRASCCWMTNPCATLITLSRCVGLQFAHQVGLCTNEVNDA